VIGSHLRSPAWLLARLAAVLAEAILVFTVEVSIALDVGATRERLYLPVVVVLSCDAHILVTILAVCTHT